MSVNNTIPRSNGDDYCQKLKPQEKAIYVRDSQVKGLVLRVKPTGSKSWIFCYSVPCPKTKWKERKKGLGTFRLGRNDTAGLTVNAARIEAERLKNDVRHNQADLHTADDAVNAMSIIIDAVGSGNITPGEGEAMSRVVDLFLKTLQEHEIEKRVSMLEQGLKK